jgi:hypothetical protein
MAFIMSLPIGLYVCGTLAVPTKAVNDHYSRSPSSTLDSPSGFKNVVFNSGYSLSQFAQIQGASNHITFGLGSNPGQIPMMAFATDVANAVNLVNSSDAPEYMLTFNEPDYSYMGVTPTYTIGKSQKEIRLGFRDASTMYYVSKC